MQCLLEVPKYHNGYHIPKLWAYVNHGVLVNKIWPVHYQVKDAKEHQQISLTSFKRTHICFSVRGAYIPLWLS